MAEVILNLPLGKRKPRSKYHELFKSVSDGKAYKISKSEFPNDTSERFRVRIQSWARTRNLLAETRIDEERNIYVQMHPIVDLP